MPRVWSHPDLGGVRNAANQNFTVSLAEGAALFCIIFNGRKLYKVALSPGPQEYTITGTAVFLGLAPKAEDSLWAYVVIEAEQTAASVLIQAQRRTFYYNIEVYDKAGMRQEIIEKDISATNWSYYALGGCGEATVILRRPYDDFGAHIILDAGIEIWRERDLLGQAGARLPAQLPIQLGTAHVGNRELRWGGFVREIERVLADDEQVILKCAGWSRQMAYIFVPEQTTPWQNVDVAVIVRDIVDRYVIPGTQIKRSPGLGLVPNTGVTVTGPLNFDSTAWDAIRVLGEIAGNAEWGVRPDRQFYFVQKINSVRQTHAIGDRVMLYRPRTSTDEIVNRVYLRGGNDFKATINFSPEAGYHKERREFVASIQDAATAQLWAAAYAARFGASEPSGQLQLGMTDDWIEGVGHPLGVLRVIGAPIFVTPGAALPAQLPMLLAVGYGKYTDEKYRIASVQYSPAEDALNVEIGLGQRKRPLSDLLETINFKLAELQQGMAL